MSLDLPGLLAEASGLLESVTGRFVAGLGAPSAVEKGPADFATAVDLELERRLSAELTARTGIAVHGEEFGGPDVGVGPVWVLDPIDGTANYSAGLPLAGMLLALLQDGVPVVGLTWLPLLGERYAALDGGPLLRNGVALPPLARGDLRSATTCVGSLTRSGGGRYPGEYRLRALGELTDACQRVRLVGATGIDLAWTAAGVLGGSVTFGHHPWDNAAGVCLVRAAGGVVTDLAGRDWRIDSPSVLAAAPGVHEEMLELVLALGDPLAVPA
ncbi:inositol monophosphatase [Rhodococcus antarcticus]|uniref:inositol-phosphate phosphatase n=1 Tax=Rhodococcus antarcticus TaxID=2987751 RepID=A0ABY6NVR6_9NOCA|nr:inositol monophosphatase [Rhodococcus antarcticus]UZJ23482.1 inositol monophosphatase [Rhodococcus antarcticus]